MVHYVLYLTSNLSVLRETKEFIFQNLVNYVAALVLIALPLKFPCLLLFPQHTRRGEKLSVCAANGHVSKRDTFGVKTNAIWPELQCSASGEQFYKKRGNSSQTMKKGDMCRKIRRETGMKLRQCQKTDHLANSDDLAYSQMSASLSPPAHQNLTQKYKLF